MSTREGYISMNTEEGLDLKVPSASTFGNNPDKFGINSSDNWCYNRYVNDNDTYYEFEDLRPYTGGECFSIAMAFKCYKFDRFGSILLDIQDNDGDTCFKLTSTDTGAVNYEYGFFNGNYSRVTKRGSSSIKVGTEGMVNFFIFSFYKQSIKITKVGEVVINPNTGERFLANYGTTEETYITVQNKDDVNFLKLFRYLNILDGFSGLELLNFYDKDILLDSVLLNELKETKVLFNVVPRPTGFNKLFTFPGKTSSFYSDGTGSKTHTISAVLNSTGATIGNSVYYTKNTYGTVSYKAGKTLLGNHIDLMRVKNSSSTSNSPASFPTMDVRFGTDKVLQFVVGFYPEQKLRSVSPIFSLLDSSNRTIFSIVLDSGNIKFKTKNCTPTIVSYSSDNSYRNMPCDGFRPLIVTITDKYIVIDTYTNFSKTSPNIAERHYFISSFANVIKHNEGYIICNETAKIVLGYSPSFTSYDNFTDYAYFGYRMFTPEPINIGSPNDTYAYSNEQIKKVISNNSVTGIPALADVIKDDFELTTVNNTGESANRIAIFTPTKSAITSTTGWVSNVEDIKYEINSTSCITTNQNSNGTYNPVILPRYNRRSGATSFTNSYLDLSSIRNQNRKIFTAIKFKLTNRTLTSTGDSQVVILSLYSKTMDESWDNVILDVLLDLNTNRLYCRKNDGYDISYSGKVEIDMDNKFKTELLADNFVTWCLEINANNIKLYASVNDSDPLVIPYSLESDAGNAKGAEKSLLWIMDKLALGYINGSYIAEPRLEIAFIDIYDRNLKAAEKSEYLAGRIPNDPNVSLTPKSSFPTDQNQITGITNGNIVNTSGVGFTDPLAPYPNENKETAFISTMDGINTETSRFTGNSILYVNYTSLGSNFSNYANAVKNWFKDKYIFSALRSGCYSSQERSMNNAISVQCKMWVYFVPISGFGGNLNNDYRDVRIPISLDSTYGLLWAEKNPKYEAKWSDNDFANGDNGCYAYIEKDIYNMLNDVKFNIEGLNIEGDIGNIFSPVYPNNYITGLDALDQLGTTCGVPSHFSNCVRIDFNVRTWVCGYDTTDPVTDVDSSVSEQTISLLFINNLGTISENNKTIQDFYSFMLNDGGTFELKELTVDKVNEWFDNNVENITPLQSDLPEVGHYLQDEDIIVLNNLKIGRFNDRDKYGEYLHPDDEGAGVRDIDSYTPDYLNEAPRASFIAHADQIYSSPVIPKFNLSGKDYIGDNGCYMVIGGYNPNDYDILYENITYSDFFFSRLYLPVCRRSVFKRVPDAEFKGTSIVFSIVELSYGSNKTFTHSATVRKCPPASFPNNMNKFTHYVVKNLDEYGYPLESDFDENYNVTSSCGDYFYNKFGPHSWLFDGSDEVWDGSDKTTLRDWINNAMRGNTYSLPTTRDGMEITVPSDIYGIKSTKKVIVIDIYQHYVNNIGEDIIIDNRTIFMFNNGYEPVNLLSEIPTCIPCNGNLTWSGNNSGVGGGSNSTPPTLPSVATPDSKGINIPGPIPDASLLTSINDRKFHNTHLIGESGNSEEEISTANSISVKQAPCILNHSFSSSESIDCSYSSFVESIRSMQGAFFVTINVPGKAASSINNLGLTFRVSVIDLNNPEEFVCSRELTIDAGGGTTRYDGINVFGDKYMLPHTLCYRSSGPSLEPYNYPVLNYEFYRIGELGCSCMPSGYFQYDTFVCLPYARDFSSRNSKVNVNPVQTTLSSFMEAATSDFSGNLMFVFDLYTTNISSPTSNTIYTLRFYHSGSKNVDFNRIPHYIPVNNPKQL